ncbi:MAG TPA: hypothetical protein VFJ06_02705 [Halococcus sp.]|nr:hypothetical protein [Halococcus sp.]
MGALDDIAFLARSQNRVAVLETLTAGLYDRAALREATGIPRPTVGRIINDFQARGLVIQRGNQYTTSPLGDFLATEFQSLLEGAETMRKLRGVVEWLPTDEFDFTLDHFADATITTPRPGDPTAPVRRSVALAREAAHIRFISGAFVPPIYEVIWQRTIHEDQTAVAVLSDDVIDMMREDPEVAELARETISSGGATLYRCAHPCSYQMAVVDEALVALLVLDDDGHAHAVIDTEDEAVLSWVASTIDVHQREAHLLDSDSFTV